MLIDEKLCFHRRKIIYRFINSEARFRRDGDKSGQNLWSDVEMWKRSREANSSVIPCCRRRHKSPSVKLLLHGFAMRLERSASLLNRKANTHCVRSVALSSCRGACLGQRLPVSTSWTGYISNHNITSVEKGPARTRPRTLWQLLVRLCPTPDYRSLSLRLSERRTRTRWAPGYPWTRGCFLASTEVQLLSPLHTNVLSILARVTGLSFQKRTVGETGNRFL